MSLKDSIKFQKTLALFAGASNVHEKKAAETAARRVMKTCNIDPTRIPNGSLYGRLNFKDNALLKKLRDEWREEHPQPVNTKKRRKPKSEPVNRFDGMFDDFTGGPVNTKEPKATPTEGVNTKAKATDGVNTSDRNRDRQAPGYMREYMRKRRAKKSGKHGGR